MSKAARQQSARERMREQRRQQAARQRTIRRVSIGASVVVVIALVVGIGVFVQSQRAAGNNVQPINIAFGKGQPVVDVYEDFQCPVCKSFEMASGDMLTKLAQQGKAKVVYHPVSIFPDAAGERSTRAASAAMCAADQGKFKAYHGLLFKKQPPESKPASAADDSPPDGNVSVEKLKGFETWKLKAYGEKVGLDGSEFAECVESDQYESRVNDYTKKLIDNGTIKGTPSLYINGKPVPFNQNIYLNPDALEQQILSAEEK